LPSWYEPTTPTLAPPDRLRALLTRRGRRGASAPPAAPEGEAARKILVVSTDPLIREETLYGFPPDFAIHFATDSREAISVMSDLRPEAVIVDIQTGNAGGFSLARDMAQIPRLQDVPILMLLERSQDDWLARQAGAEKICLKPIETGELVDQTLELIAASA
jgi:DNA-binding response OmpR family regulator